MRQLKPISKEAIPRALDKAERYRLLNEPLFAESICLDVLAADPDDERALITYVLALADQFGLLSENNRQKAQKVIERMKSEYDRRYYAGIISERWAVALLHRGGNGSNPSAWRYLQSAMDAYEKADEIQQDATNDDAVLRYNTCLRTIEAYHLSEPAPDQHDYPLE
jgi:hypothetical protein